MFLSNGDQIVENWNRLGNIVHEGRMEWFPFSEGIGCYTQTKASLTLKDDDGNKTV